MYLSDVKDLCPEYLRDIYEIKYLCKALNSGFSRMHSIMSIFVYGMTLYLPETGVTSHWRAMLDDGDKLSDYEGEKKILARLKMDEIVNFEFITKYLDGVCLSKGHETSFDPDAMLLTVKTPAPHYVREAAEKYLREAVPCNIAIKIVASEEAVSS